MRRRAESARSTRIRIVVDLSARSISNKENCNPGLPGGSHETGHAGYGTRIVRLIIVVHFLVGERALKGQLKIGAADNGLIDIEDYRWREIFGMLLSWHRAPGLVVDESGQRTLGRLVDLHCYCAVLRGMFHPENAQIPIWRMTNRCRRT